MKKNSVLGLLVLSMLAASCSLAAHFPVILEDGNTGMTVNFYGSEFYGMRYYENARFGYSVSLPDFFTVIVHLNEGPNSCEMALTSEDGSHQFSVTGGFVFLEEQFQEALKNFAIELEENVKNAVITVNTGDDWWEVSWRGDTESGIRRNITNGEIWAECEIRWPAELYNAPTAEASIDDVVELFERSVRSIDFSVG